MVNPGSLNGGTTAAATDLEKGEVWEEDLEEREAYETEEGGGDLEKRGRGGAVGEVSEPSLTDPLLTPAEAEHHGLAAASKRLVLTEKIVLSLVVFCFVVVEAYFVGRSFRNWIDDDEHLHDDNGKSINNTEFEPMPSRLEVPFLPPIDGGGLGSESEPFERMWEGRSDSGEKNLMNGSLEEVSPITKSSTTTAHLPPDIELNSQTEEEARISTEFDGGDRGI